MTGAGVEVYCSSVIRTSEFMLSAFKRCLHFIARVGELWSHATLRLWLRVLISQREISLKKSNR
jgi:hypothetical protein